MNAKPRQRELALGRNGRQNRLCAWRRRPVDDVFDVRMEIAVDDGSVFSNYGVEVGRDEFRIRLRRTTHRRSPLVEFSPYASVQPTPSAGGVTVAQRSAI